MKPVSFALLQEPETLQLRELIAEGRRGHSNFFLDRLGGERKHKVWLVGSKVDEQEECLRSKHASRVFPVVIVNAKEIPSKRRAVNGYSSLIWRCVWHFVFLSP